MLKVGCVTLRQIDPNRIQALHRKRGQHKRHQQKEHYIDHRDDLDAATAIGSRATKPHRASLPLRGARAVTAVTISRSLFSWSNRMWSTSFEPRRSIRSSACDCTRAKKLKPKSAKIAISKPNA